MSTKSVEDLLRDALHGSGMKPKQIGKEAGVDFGAIYKFLAGNAELRSGTFSKLCEWAGLTLTMLEGNALEAQQQRERSIREEAEEIAMGIIERLAKTARDDLRRAQ